jgi:hypothetical protein
LGFSYGLTGMGGGASHAGEASRALAPSGTYGSANVLKLRIYYSVSTGVRVPMHTPFFTFITVVLYVPRAKCPDKAARWTIGTVVQDIIVYSRVSEIERRSR